MVNDQDFPTFQGELDKVGTDNVEYGNKIHLSSHVTSTAFQFYLDSTIVNALKQKEYANSKINEPLFVFLRHFTFNINSTLEKNDLCRGLSAFCNYGIIHHSGHLIESLFNLGSYSNQFSSRFGEVDVVDLKLMRHKLIEKFDDYEVVLVLRNRYNSFIELNKTVSNQFEGIFKNSYIDVLLPKPTDEFKCDPNKEIFKTERYSLTSLEHELNVTNSEPSNFHGLEPYELAEFRVVRSVTLEKLEIKQKKLAQGIDSGKRD